MIAPARSWQQKLHPYLPGILLFIAATVLGLFLYQDYGISWDETYQRKLGLISWDYIFNGNKDLLKYNDRVYGPFFELILVVFEKTLKISDSRDIYLMRHLVSHLFFLIGCFSMYVLAFRLFRHRFVACVGMLMLLLAPRLYAHSFFNSKDGPMLVMFLITLTVAQAAFIKYKAYLFFIAGACCGITTGIRIAGIILFAIIMLFLVIDLCIVLRDKQKLKRSALRVLLFTTGFCIALYVAWPYLWQNPVVRFIEGYKSMAHYNWTGNILFNGRAVNATRLPWTYFPAWFAISVPVCWLAFGICGIVWVILRSVRAPGHAIQNTRERYFILLLFCFAGPVIAVILLHSVIYDDWRHLYFVYPAFILLSLYAVDRLLQTKAKAIVIALCTAQVIWIGWFMVRYHPFQQVYFNELVSHDKDYLTTHFEMDYWAAGYKQALDYIVLTDQREIIKVATGYEPVTNNVMMLQERDRKRIQVTDDAPDYLITNFRSVAFNEYDKFDSVYVVRVLNSKILSVYKPR